MKALARTCDDVAAFPPGHVYDSARGELTHWYKRAWRDYDAVQGVAATRPNCARRSSARCIAS